MIRLNTLGEDAFTVLLEGSGPEIASQASDVSWFDEDTLLVTHGGSGKVYLVDRDRNFALLKSEIFTPATAYSSYVGIQSGGRRWVGSVHFPPDKWIIAGELGRGGPPFPPEAGDNAQLGDVNQRGDVVVVTLGAGNEPSMLKLIPAGSDRVQALAAYQLQRPPRISPCGRTLSWLSGNDRRAVEVMLDGKRGSVELPAPPLLTPRLFEFYDAWWALSISVEYGITLTPVADPYTGYQWIVPDPQHITDLDAILTDQVYVVFERTQDGRTLTWSEGLAPGMDMQPLAELPPIKAALAELEQETAAQDAAGLPPAPEPEPAPELPKVLEFPNGSKIHFGEEPNLAGTDMQREIEQILGIPAAPPRTKYEPEPPAPAEWRPPSLDDMPEWEAEVINRFAAIEKTLTTLATAVEQIKIVHAHYPSSDPAINAIEAARAVGRVAQKMEATIDGLKTEIGRERVFSFRVWKWTFRGIIYSPKPEKALERRDTPDFDE